MRRELRRACISAVLVLLVAALFLERSGTVLAGLVPAPWDELAHAGVFGVMALLLHGGLRLPAWLAVLLTVLVGAADELHQAFVPGGVAGLDDWIADLFAALAGVLIAGFVRRMRSAAKTS